MDSGEHIAVIGPSGAGKTTLLHVLACAIKPSAGSLENVALTLAYYAGSAPSGTALSAAPSTAGTYTVVASFAGSTNYSARGQSISRGAWGYGIRQTKMVQTRVPLAFAIFSLFWIATGIISLTVGYRIGVALMLEGGAGPLAGPSVVAGALADLAIGLAIALRPATRFGLYGAIALTLFYVVAGTLLVPRLWAEPLGPLLKIWPILALNLILLAILEER